ncbi:hypothetical protein glysoja_024470, partial [Glycine soja]
YMMEKLDWKASSTRAKSIGTLVTIAGALIMSLYKGQAVINNNPPFKLFPQKLVSSMQFDWAFGALLLAAHSCFLTISYILAVIGAAIVVIGFYDVIWGKSQEKVEEDCAVYSSESYDNEVPLLQNKRMGE